MEIHVPAEKTEAYASAQKAERLSSLPPAARDLKIVRARKPPDWLDPELETVDLDCPYCGIGRAPIQVKRNGKNIEFNMRDYPKCDCCKRFFRVRPRLQFVGVKLEEDGGPPHAV